MKTGLKTLALLMLIGLTGCASNGLRAPSMDQVRETFDFSEQRKKTQEFFRAKFGESSGVDPKAREIEKRLGF